MKRALSLFCLASLSLLSATGCKRATSSGAGGNSSITVAGSNSMLPFVEAWGEAYMAAYPDRKVNVQGGGSTAGVKAAQTGSAQIGDVSRDLHADETGLTPTTVARDGLSVVVEPGNPVSEMTLAQVKAIFTGKAKSWKEFGGPDVPITVITREEGSGARGAFEEIALNKEHISSTALVQDSTGGIREMVHQDRNAIGFGTMGQMQTNVKALKINAVAATEENVANGTYPLVHPFLMVTKGPPAGAAKEFIDWVLSPAGQALAKKEGLIPAR